MVVYINDGRMFFILPYCSSCYDMFTNITYNIIKGHLSFFINVIEYKFLKLSINMVKSFHRKIFESNFTFFTTMNLKPTLWFGVFVCVPKTALHDCLQLPSFISTELWWILVLFAIITNTPLVDHMYF